MDFSQNIVVPVSGWVQNIEPGKKCLHGVYIPSTQEDQTYAEKCQVCTSLRAFLEKHDMTIEEIEARQRIFRSHTSKEDIQDFLKSYPIRRKQSV
jgi:hypothetical protein